jgi:hypothetical protein
MTVEVAQRRTRKPKARSSMPLAIGEIDQTVFACPTCTRPLTLGARRCQGCGTRLILGVQAQRASIFAAVGLVAGLVLAGGFGATISAIEGTIRDADAAAAAAAAAAMASPSAEPSAATSPSMTTGTPTATAGTIDPSVPALSRSALLQATALNDRLASSSAGLAAALNASKFDTVGVGQILRAASAEAVFGLELSAHIGAWPGGTQLSGELASFYSSVRQTAAEGLAASVRNENAYRTAGQNLLKLFGGLDELDGRVREVAGQARVTLPPADAPAP